MAAGRMRFMKARADASLQPTPSRERNVHLDAAGPVVARRHANAHSRNASYGPLALPAIAREVMVGKECLQRGLARAALELRALDARLAAGQLGAGWKRDLVDH